MDIQIPRGLPQRQATFLCLLAARPSLNRRDYQRLMKVSHNTAQRDLAELRAAHLILAVGTGPCRRYALGLAAVNPERAGELLGRPSDPNLAAVTVTVDQICI